MLLKNQIKIIPRRLISDERGWFLKVIDGKEECLPNHVGEVYLTNAKVNQAKGGHFHVKASEWFTLVIGSCDLLLVDIETKEKMAIALNSENPITVYVPSGIAHIFVNTGNDEFLLIAYSDLLYDPIDTIAYNFSDI